MQNVDLAHERWGRDLKGQEFRALEWMALRSWDVGSERNGDPPRRYWGGHPLLAFGMGLIERSMLTRTRAERGDKPILTRSQENYVRRVVRCLEKAHAITTVEPGGGHQRAVYDLNLDLVRPTGQLWIPLEQPPSEWEGSQ